MIRPPQTMQSHLRRWDVLASLAKQIEAETFVEVGCKAGRTTGHMLKALPPGRAICVDPWRALPNEAEDYADWDFEQIEAEFWENVKGNEARVEMLRMTSLEAAERVETADLVFIDAGHDRENCRADIGAWWPKVREGGIMAGHDYNHKWPGVMRAVADSFPLLMVGVMPDSVWFVRK